MKVLHATLLNEIVRRLVAALQPETIYLYGSHSYGQPHEDSDVDLLVVLREATRSGHESAVEAHHCAPSSTSFSRCFFQRWRRGWTLHG